MTSQPIVPLDRSHSPYFAGVDVGGTTIKIGIVDSVGNTLAFDEIATNELGGPQLAMQACVAAIDAMLASLNLHRASLAAVGLGTPGPQDVRAGMLIEPPNHPHWHHFPIVDCLQKLVGHPVAFANDANAAAWGEFWLGSGRENHSMILLTLGTGVGGGVIMDEQLLIGENSFAGECGHILVDSRPDARLCAWGGGRGHLEAYASASAVIGIVKERVAAGEQSLLSDPNVPINGLSIYEAALKDDALALEIIDQTADYLSVGITSMICTLDPGLVVLGGAMNFGGMNCKLGRRFLEDVQAGIRRHCFANVADATEIRFAQLAGDAGYLGAAGLAWDMIRKKSTH